MNKKIITILLSIALVALIVFAVLDFKEGSNNSITKEEAVNKALTYINQNLLGGQYTASLKEIVEDKKDPSFYIFKINIEGETYESLVTADGRMLVANMNYVVDLDKKIDAQVDGAFYLKEDAEIITEDGKPIVYLFTSSTCPHCEWEKPVLQAVIDSFEGNVILKVREDTTEDQDVYNKFGQGGVPLVVLGGKYYREGAGENFGEEKEKEYLTKYICELTNNLPETICIK